VPGEAYKEIDTSRTSVRRVSIYRSATKYGSKINYFDSNEALINAVKIGCGLNGRA
jgi:hypothetical protein